MIPRTRLRACATLLIVAAAALHAQAPAPVGRTAALRGGIIAAQVSSGIVGTVGGFVGGGLTTRWLARKFGADEENVSRSAHAGAYTAAALVTGVGPALIGARDGAHGSYPASVGGAIVGGLVSVLIKRLGDRGVFGERGPVAIVAGVAIVSMPGLGATLAYNATR